MTTTHLPLLRPMSIASPCTARWDDMTGDERSRHCADCGLRVHNISAMTDTEAEALLAHAADGRLCVKFYRRADGTVLTQDCPVGLSAARARLRRAGARLAAALGLIVTGSVAANVASDPGRQRLRSFRPFSTLAAWLVPAPPPIPPAVQPWSRAIMGKVICTPAPPTPPPSPPPTPPPAANTLGPAPN